MMVPKPGIDTTRKLQTNQYSLLICTPQSKKGEDEGEERGGEGGGEGLEMSRSWCWEYLLRQSASPAGRKPWTPTLMPNKLGVVVNSIWMQEYQKFRLILGHILSMGLA